MATAVQPTPTTKSAPSPRLRLAVASLAGAAFVVGGLAVALFVLPRLWQQSVAPTLAVVPGVELLLRLVAEVIAVVGIAWVGIRLAGANPPRGLRGGIFVVVSLAITAFFIVRAVGLNVPQNSTGQAIVLAAAVASLVGIYFAVTSPALQGWMVAIEDAGVLHTFSYKRSQGVRVRRYTLLGILLIGWTGVYAMVNNQTLAGDLQLTLPFVDSPVTLLPAAGYSVPLLLAVLTFWAAWRAVNVPTFADFLIATEAEMNKVSWSTRKRLVQDTVVVLVTTLLLTGFLLAVDIFWGWLLSLQAVGVLPARSPSTAPGGDPVVGRQLDW